MCLQACQPRDAEAASLIRLDIASHPAAEARADSGRVPAGLEYWSVDVRITQLEVVFLNRFLQVSVQACLCCFCQAHDQAAASRTWI